MIKLSIIIPHYNTPVLLKKLLKTIPNIPEIEIIVIDDLSTEGKDVLSECIEENSDRNVFFLTNSIQNKGAGNARNLGLSKATGEWILFADADDYFTEKFWDIVSKKLSNNVDIIYFEPTSIMISTGEPSERHVHYMDLVQRYCEKASKENELKLRYMFWSPCSKMIQNELIRRFNIEFDGTLHSNDMMFSTKVGYYAHKIEAVEETIYVITQSNQSLTANKENKNIKERKDVLCRYFFFLASKLSIWDMKKIGYGFKDYLYYSLYRMNLLP